MAEPKSAEDFAAAQESEYGTYVAVRDINHGGARAYSAGSPVPVSNVKRHDYEAQGLVAKTSSKAAQDAARTASTDAVEAPLQVPVSLSVPLV